MEPPGLLQSYTLGCRSGNEIESEPEEVSASDLANSLIASKEAMSVLESALVGQVVGALQAHGLVPSQDQPFGGQPAMVIHIT